MEQIIVTHKDGSTIRLNSGTNVSAVTKASQTGELLGVDTVDITVESATKLTFLLGDKITIIGRDYTLNTPARERKIASNHFVYDLQFEGVQYDLLRASYNVNVNTTNNAIQDLNGDALTGDIKIFLDVLISNANRVFPGKWVLGTYPAGTETKTLTFSESDNCLSVLQNLCSEDQFNTEFSIAIAGNGVRTLNVGATGTTHAYTYQYGQGKGLYELTRQKVSSTNIVNRLMVYGSNKNINTLKYRAQRLCLPTKSKGQSYLESSASITKYGVWEQTKIFEDVYPSRTGTLTDFDPGAPLELFDSSMDFDLNAKDISGNTLYLIPGTSAKIHFNTGKLAGYEFEISEYNHTTKMFKIIKFTDENGYTFPSEEGAAFQPAIGDKYVLIDIYMPDSYVTAKETELQTKGQEWLDKYSQPKVAYTLNIDPFFLKNIVGAEAESNIIWVGDYIPIKDTDLDVDKTIRVKSFTRDLLNDYSYNLTIADLTITVNTITRIVNELNGLDTIVKINNLNDPARARQSYKNAQEVLNMVFDGEGNFYTDKIAPLSIDTTMLSVGAKYMQFGMIGTVFQTNYGGAKNRVVYSGGTLTHYAVLDGSNNPSSWTIQDGDVVLATDGAYYIYAKCSKTTTAGSILFSTTQILVDSDASFYHFLIGVINSVGSNNERAIALMYGFTTINGRFIKTGRIVSAAGTNRFFDIDTGEFQGSFKFTSGVDVETALDTAQETADDAMTNANAALASISNIVSDNVLSADEKPSQRQEWDIINAEKAGINTQATNFGITTENTTYNNAFQALATYLNAGIPWDSQYETPAWLSDLTTNTTIVGSVYRSTWLAYYDARTALLNAIATKAKTLADNAQSSADLIRVELGQSIYSETFNETQAQFDARWTNYSGSGNKTITVASDATGGKKLVVGDGTGNDQVWIIGNTSIPFDPTRLYVIKARVRRVSGSGLFYLGVAGRNNLDTAWVNVTGADSSSSQHYCGVGGASPGSSWVEYTGYFKGYGTPINSAINPLSPSPLHANVRYFRPLMILNYSGQAGVFEVDYVSINFGDVDAEAASTSYLKTALTGSTEISGGLVGTNVLLLKTLAGIISGGFSGLGTDNVGMWTGGTYTDAIESLAKILFRKDGSGQLAGGKILWDLYGAMMVGDFRIEGGAIIGYADNKDKVKFHTGSIDTLANLTAGNWVQAPGTYSITKNDSATNPDSDPVEVNKDYHSGYVSLTVPANTQAKFYPATFDQYLSPLASYFGLTSTQYYEVYKDGSLIYNWAPSTTTVRTLTAGGTYTVRLRLSITFNLYANKSVTIEITTISAGYVTYQPTVEKTEIGKNGFYSYWSNLLYMYFSDTEGFKLKGQTDIPGLLASGSIASGGGLTRSFGKASDSSKSTTGTYVITHDIGHTNYTIQITPQTSSRIGYISARTNTTCTVILTNTSGTATDTGFDFAITGSN